MSQSEQKVVQYLGEAHASEIGLVSVLRSQIAITPRGSYRDGLDKHLAETRKHADRLQQRLGELQGARNPLQALVGFTETLVSQSLALSKTPFDLLRGTGGEEKVLKNAKDAYATEALEIATYTALERLAVKVGDSRQLSSPGQSAPMKSGCSSGSCARFRSSPTRSLVPKSRVSPPTTSQDRRGRRRARCRARGQAHGAQGPDRGQAHCSAGAQGSRRRAGRGADQGSGRLRGGSRDRAL